MRYRDKQIVGKLVGETIIIMQMIDGLNYHGFIGDEKTKRAVCMDALSPAYTKMAPSAHIN
jgi:hypothetical protein